MPPTPLRNGAFVQTGMLPRLCLVPLAFPHAAKRLLARPAGWSAGKLVGWQQRLTPCDMMDILCSHRRHGLVKLVPEHCQRCSHPALPRRRGNVPLFNPRELQDLKTTRRHGPKRHQMNAFARASRNDRFGQDLWWRSLPQLAGKSCGESSHFDRQVSVASQGYSPEGPGREGRGAWTRRHTG